MYLEILLATLVLSIAALAYVVHRIWKKFLRAMDHERLLEHNIGEIVKIIRQRFVKIEEELKKR